MLQVKKNVVGDLRNQMMKQQVEMLVMTIQSACAHVHTCTYACTYACAHVFMSSYINLCCHGRYEWQEVLFFVFFFWTKNTFGHSASSDNVQVFQKGSQDSNSSQQSETASNVKVPPLTSLQNLKNILYILYTYKIPIKYIFYR